jgi:hypothetical protein
VQTGECFIKIRVGMPATLTLMVLDTGSDVAPLLIRRNEDMFVAVAGLLSMRRGNLPFPTQIPRRYGQSFKYYRVDCTLSASGVTTRCGKPWRRTNLAAQRPWRRAPWASVQ